MMGLEDDFIDFPFGAQIFRGDVKNLHEVPINKWVFLKESPIPRVPFSGEPC